VLKISLPVKPIKKKIIEKQASFKKLVDID